MPGSIDIRAEIASHREAFQMNELALRHFLGQHGPVGHDLARRAIKVESAAKQHATTRPGPNVITGRLRGSITWRLEEDEHGVFALVGTSVEYARRIELGFDGTDSLGRTYSQPAYPFLRPALEAAH